jgi:hypothetical protein
VFVVVLSMFVGLGMWFGRIRLGLELFSVHKTRWCLLVLLWRGEYGGSVELDA